MSGRKLKCSGAGHPDFGGRRRIKLPPGEESVVPNTGIVKFGCKVVAGVACMSSRFSI